MPQPRSAVSGLVAGTALPAWEHQRWSAHHCCALQEFPCPPARIYDHTHPPCLLQLLWTMSQLPEVVVLCYTNTFYQHTDNGLWWDPSQGPCREMEESLCCKWSDTCPKSPRQVPFKVAFGQRAPDAAHLYHHANDRGSLNPRVTTVPAILRSNLAPLSLARIACRQWGLGRLNPSCVPASSRTAGACAGWGRSRPEGPQRGPKPLDTRTGPVPPGPHCAC